MTLATPYAGDPRNGMYRLPESLPDKWMLEEFVYSRITIEAPSVIGGGGGKPGKPTALYFKSSPDCIGYPLGAGITNLKEFVQAVVGNTLPNTGTSVKPGAGYETNPKSHSLMDFGIRKSCMVVIELDPDIEWQFRTYDVGVTSKYDYSKYVGALYHLDNTGTTLPSDKPSEGKCRFVAFAAMSRRFGEAQHFNLHVELLQRDTALNRDMRPLEIMIDPDIPNDGGHIPGQ